MRGEAATVSRLRVGSETFETRRLPGRAERPTLVLLHEGLGCVALWRDFPDRLAAATGCPVFLYSRLGYGASDPRPLPWPLDYMQREGLETLPAVLAAAGIGRSVLVGHSDGASIALVNAGARASAGVEGVVVMAPHVFAEPMGLDSIREAWRAFDAGDLRRRLARYHQHNVDCAFRGWCESWLHPEFLAWNIESYLPGISVPLLQIQGRDDQYGSPAQLDAIARQVAGPVETHLLDHCRHAPQSEQPEVTLDLIARFTAGVQP